MAEQASTAWAWRTGGCAAPVAALLWGALSYAAADPFTDAKPTGVVDPFAEVAPAATSGESVAGALGGPAEQSSLDRFLGDNFTLKLELMSQFSVSDAADAWEDVYSRQSAGFEVLKRFSTRTATVASLNLQARFVRRDHYLPVINDMEGEDREGWCGELHNAYVDVYNVFSPFLSDAGQAASIGRYNLRVGRFYLPMGLNLQTDTHGTLLQLSNDRNLGFERDWYAGFWGALNEHLNYDLYGLLGSGSDLVFRGQDGMLGGRLSLGPRYLREYGLEGGLALLCGERLSQHAVERSASVRREAQDGRVVDTLRVGPDLRYTRLVPSGTMTWTTELTAGTDEADEVFTQLHQLEYLNRSRRWGTALQYRRFWQDFERDSAAMPGGAMTGAAGDAADASLVGEVTWYFRNDVGNTTLHWVKLNVEQQTERQYGDPETIVSLQYYRYW